MDSGPSEPKDQGVQQPDAEVLSQRAASGAPSDAAETKTPTSQLTGKLAHRTFRPSHRATFIGLAVVAVILAVNAGVIFLILKSQAKDAANTPQGQVTVSQDVLDHLGVNRGTVGDSGIVLTIAPSTEFKDKVVVDRDISVAGQLRLNGAFNATDASLAKLEAGSVTANQLNVSGDSTVSNLSLRNDLTVNGATRLQGAVTLSQLLTVNNSVNIASNLSVGGTVSAATLSGRSIVSTSTITVGGHIVTAGLAPSLSGGVSLGSGGTLTISGNDAAGTVAINVGVGMSSGGIVANVTFRTPYSTTPHVVITPIGNIGTYYYVNRSASGFSIGIGGAITNPGGYAFDYIVEQ